VVWHNFRVARHRLKPRITLTPLAIPADFLNSVEWTHSRPSYEQARKLASRKEQEKTDAVCPDDLPHTGRVRHAEE
jgi:hypothetical protein